MSLYPSISGPVLKGTSHSVDELMLGVISLGANCHDPRDLPALTSYRDYTAVDPSTFVVRCILETGTAHPGDDVLNVAGIQWPNQPIAVLLENKPDHVVGTATAFAIVKPGEELPDGSVRSDPVLVGTLTITDKDTVAVLVAHIRQRTVTAIRTEDADCDNLFMSLEGVHWPAGPVPLMLGTKQIGTAQYVRHEDNAVVAVCKLSDAATYKKVKGGQALPMSMGYVSKEGK